MSVDCSTVCTVGTLSDDCSHCECSDDVTVQVFSNRGQSLPNVTISHTSAPLTVLDTSESDGILMLTQTCDGHTYILQRDGYIDAEYTIGSGTTVTMQIIGKFPFSNLVLIQR